MRSKYMNTRKDECPKYSYNSGLCDSAGNPVFGEDLDYLFNEVENGRIPSDRK